jgi:DNA N6-methyl adenine demethylase
MAAAPQCNCTGLRYCASCVDSDRVKSIREDSEKNGVDLARAVFEKNKQHIPQSSCAFSALPSVSSMVLCTGCGKVFNKPELSGETFLDSTLGCSAHETDGWELNGDVELLGLYTFKNMISVEYETHLSEFLDGKPRRVASSRSTSCADNGAANVSSPFPGWKDSQSGRRKQDFGPAPNFKKRKVKPSELPGMPLELKELLETTMEQVDAVTVNPVTELPSFIIAQASCLDYDSASLSNLDPHVDDVWLWGPRVAGVSLLAGCLMTFVREDGVMVDVHLPQRWGFVMSGESRYQWLHGIRHSAIKGRRLSITMREVAPGAGLEDELKQAILAFAQHFV